MNRALYILYPEASVAYITQDMNLCMDFERLLVGTVMYNW
jgi:hypothetical protein